jgi:hypothetical protein
MNDLTARLADIFSGYKTDFMAHMSEAEAEQVTKPSRRRLVP